RAECSCSARVSARKLCAIPPHTRSSRQRPGTCGRFPVTMSSMDPKSPASDPCFVHMPKTPLLGANLVGGAFDPCPDAPRIEVHSPYTGALLGSVPDSRAEDVAQAVSRAREAFRAWALTSIKERSAPLFRFRALLLQQLDE